MAKSKFDKKSCLRFKLVHRSVRTEADELESNLTDAGVGVPREEEGHLYAADREFVPINQKSSENIDLIRKAVSSPATSTKKTVTFNVVEDEIINLEESRFKAGEAAKYGIMFDDRNYDYTRHLRIIGDSPDAVFVGPSEPKMMIDEQENLNRIQDYDESDDGVMEVMEALEDNAYVDEETFEDDFVVKLDREALSVLSPIDEQMRHYIGSGEYKNDDCSWSTEDDRGSDENSFAATIKTHKSFTPSLATTNIEGKFENVLRLYEEDDLSDQYEYMDSGSSDEDDFLDMEKEIDGPALQKAMNEFLERERDYINPKQSDRRAEGAARFLEEMRQEMGPVPECILDRQYESEEDENVEDVNLFQKKRLQFDVQSILTTRTNTDNLPNLIREASKRFPNGNRFSYGKEEIQPINVCARTGLPIERKDSNAVIPRDEDFTCSSVEQEEEEEEEEEEERVNKGIARSRNENPEEKKVRKAAVKEERRLARANKKETKIRYKLEIVS